MIMAHEVDNRRRNKSIRRGFKGSIPCGSTADLRHWFIVNAAFDVL